MKVSDEQRRILSAVLLQADKPNAEIARSLGIREHTVRRAVTFFVENKIFLGRRVFVDPYALGLTHHLVLLSLPRESEKDRKKFLDVLHSCNQVGVVVELGGEFQFEVRVYSRGPEHLRVFFDELTVRFPHPYHVQGAFVVWEQEYSGLADPPTELPIVPVFRYAPHSRVRVLDEMDSRILFALANSSYLTLQEVAREVGVPASTLKYRIQSLEKDGVIVGHYYLIDVKVFRELPMGLLIKSKVLGENERVALRNFCRVHPRVAWITFFLGGYSAEIFVRVTNYEEAKDLTHDISTKFSNVIESITHLPQLSFLKYSMYPFKPKPTMGRSKTGKE